MDRVKLLHNPYRMPLALGDESGRDLTNNVTQTADILKADIDCLEEIFDFLSRKDLISVGKTCKRLLQVTGHYLQQDSLGIIHEPNSLSIPIYHNDLYHFAPFIRKLVIWRTTVELLQSFQSRFRLLKHIEIRICDSQTKVNVNSLTVILSKVEALDIFHCILDEQKYDIIDQCPNLKHLGINEGTIRCDFFNRKYPMLESLKLIDVPEKTIRLAILFLKHNPNIRKFEVEARSLLRCRDLLTEIVIKLDELAIFLDDYSIGMFDLLRQLWERQFYERLEITTIRITQKTANQLATLNVVKLSVCDCCDYPPERKFTLSSLKSLEEIETGLRSQSDGENLAKHMINLKSLRIFKTNLDFIMPLIKLAPSMRKITVIHIDGGIHYNKDTHVIDLKALNRERESLPYARKITLYTSEKVYLATKWALGQTDFGLIQLRRLDSYER